MAMKRKTVATQKAGAFARNTRKVATKAAANAEKAKLKKDAKEAAKEEEDEAEEEEEVGEVMKRPAGRRNMEVEEEASGDADEDEDEDEEDEDADEDEEDDSKHVSKKPAAASSNCDDIDAANAQIVALETKEPTEADINRERTKELKAMSAASLKELVTNLGLETGTKEVMIGRVVKHEAKLRKEALAHKAKIRAVVTQKKQELEEMPLPTLTKLCNDAGFKGLRSKPEKVQRLLLRWQEHDGVDQAFASLAIQERREQLEGLENEQLRKLCGKYGFDAHVKEIMVDRISKKEHEMSCYLRPGIKELADATTDSNKLDVVEALLASEAQRKKDQDIRNKREEAIQSKSKEYRAMSLDELKKSVAKKKLASGEKKEEMVAALMLASIQEDLAAARKAELQSKPTQTLVDLLVVNGLDGTGSKDKMIKRFLDHEAKVNDDLKAFERHVDVAAKERQAELEKKNNAQLKDLCGDQGLALGGAKEERIERLVEEEKKSRAFDSVVSKNMRAKRRDALMLMSKTQILEICAELEVDPLMKEVMIERIMAHEKEHPSTEQPKAKRARVST